MRAPHDDDSTRSQGSGSGRPRKSAEETGASSSKGTSFFDKLKRPTKQPVKETRPRPTPASSTAGPGAVRTYAQAAKGNKLEPARVPSPSIASTKSKTGSSKGRSAVDLLKALVGSSSSKVDVNDV
ncbi:hypothetical protein OH77DRAFT_1430792 [Trametes cingulata]|nr:hypothetical protein OH77DRAFT_1430792 [Trametes cingulata]